MLCPYCPVRISARAGQQIGGRHRRSYSALSPSGENGAGPASSGGPAGSWVQLPAPRLLVLGDMGEVGDHAFEFHTEVGDWARQLRDWGVTDVDPKYLALPAADTAAN